MEPLAKSTVSPVPGQGQQPPANTDQPPAQTTQTEYVSKDEAQRMADEAAERAFKRSQALITKSNARIREEVTRLENLNKAAGITMTPEQRQVVTDQVTTLVLAESPQAPEVPGQGRGMPDAEIDRINNEATELMELAGVEILPTDPEAATLDQSSEAGFKTTLRAAIIAKRARTSAVQPKTTSNPGLGTVGSPPSNYRPGEGLTLISEYYKNKGNP